MNRRTFIELSAILAGVSPFIRACQSPKKIISGSIIGASSKRGHLLRTNEPFEISSTEQKKMVIVGGGVSGLSAARYLHLQQENDFILLELEDHPGGNAASGKNEVSAFPWGAHYIPIPNNDLTEYLDFLQQIGVIVDFDKEGLPVFNEQYLCQDPQERLYINGRWQDGLIPQFGVPDKELKQIQHFLQVMDAYRDKKGNDNLFAFAIPVNQSSKDPEYVALDGITMKQWMDSNQFTSTYLQQYVNYCCRDDFGTRFDQISAWAGIHYFAGRKGKANNAEHSDVLTWPDGNGFLVNHLKKDVNQHIKTACLVRKITYTNTEVWVDYLNTVTNAHHRIVASQCIICVPQFIAARLLSDTDRLNQVTEKFHYAPWMVANFAVKGLEERSGAPLSWDNVLQNGQSLGYVEANHQVLTSQAPVRNLTYYLPLTESSAKEDRKNAQLKSHADWVELVLKELEVVHPNIRTAIDKMDIVLWGHAMAQPLPGMIHGESRRKLSESIGTNLHFAHTDLAGISIFEEAFYQGINAAKKTLKKL